MKLITLNSENSALVDDDDYDMVSKYKWYLGSNGYVARNRPMVGRVRGGQQTLHRLIMGEPECEIDHINKNPLDNRKSNLRLATRQENSFNKSKYATNTSGYKGVHRVKRKWRAQITVGYKQIHLGYYDSADEAANAYRLAAKNMHGEFARTE